jgi:hypothetical protein
MPHGSNRHTKQQVQAGLLCYVCVKATPTRVDDIGGGICEPCFTHMQTQIAESLLKNGYRIRTPRIQKKGQES